MFPQFGATAESLTKASSLVLRIGTDAHLYDDPDDVNIAPLLDSRFDSEKSEALKRLLALIAQGADVSHLFPQVVKNVASQSLEVKKLVYLYLLHYAEKRPNEALLSINCFQKDLSDTNPLVRAWALRAMAGIRLHVVAPLVLVAVSKCARDPSSYVRKCAAHALPKIYDLHQDENTYALEELVDILLGDHSPGVIGAAAAAFIAVCPNNLSLIAKHFRRLCEILPDVEEWGQIVLIEILLQYVVARHGLVKESIMFTLNSTKSSEYDEDSAAVGNMSDSHCGSVGVEACDIKLNSLMCRYYIEGTKEYLAQSGCTNGDDNNFDCSVLTSSQNDDVKILLQCTSPLLWSQNSAVVLAAAGVHWIMAPSVQVKRIVKPVLFILRSSHASKYVMLCNILVFAKTVPSLFAPYFEDFFICSSDPYHIRALKLEILSTIATESSVPIILEEFQDYIKDPDRRFVADTVAAIGLCAQRLPVVAATCLEGLLAVTVHESSMSISGNIDGEANVLVQAIMSIKAIIKENPAAHEKVILHLARNLDMVKEPAARALIIWIIGEYSSVGELIPKIVLTVLKYLAWSFTSEELETKLQILNSTCKVVLHSQGEEVRKILSYIIEMSRYDMNYDVRDRSRMVAKLMPSNTPPCLEEITSCPLQNGGTYHEFVENIFSGKIPLKANVAKNYRIYLPGSLSQIVLHAAPGYRPLPKPCSLLDSDFNLNSEVVDEPEESAEIIGRSNSFETNDPDISSGSSIEESGSAYDSQHSIVSSADSDGTGLARDSNDNDHTLVVSHGAEDSKEIPLVHLSDASIDYGHTNQSAEENISAFISKDLTEVMSKSALESWLNEQPSLLSLQKSERPSSAKISINDLDFTVKPKFHTLLDPANGNGLKVEYSFSSEVSTISPLLVCVAMFFENLSAEPLMKITLKDGESGGSLESADRVFEEPERLFSANDVPAILPVEELASLDPGQRVKKVIQVHFHHHLLPLKLSVFCNGKNFLTKLWPDIGYFMRPLLMDMKVFNAKEHELPGMFEYSKRCIFKDHVEEIVLKDQRSLHPDDILLVSQSLASKVLSNANVHLVSVDIPVSFNADDVSGLCLRFSGEILNSSKPCLITVTAEGKVSESLNVTVKVNCEDTIFGLNLLNRAAAFLP